LLVLSLGVGFFVCVVAVCHAFAPDPRTHERVGCAAPVRSGFVFYAYAAVKDDVDAPPAVLFDG
jgi:hypothetical protein